MAQEHHINTKYALEFEGGMPSKEAFFAKLEQTGIVVGAREGLWNNFSGKLADSGRPAETADIDTSAPFYCICDTLGGERLEFGSGTVDNAKVHGETRELAALLNIGHVVVRADNTAVELTMEMLERGSIAEPARTSPHIPALDIPGVLAGGTDSEAVTPPSINRDRGIGDRYTGFDDTALQAMLDEDELDVGEELDLMNEGRSLKVKLPEDKITKEDFSAAYLEAAGAAVAPDVIDAAYAQFEFMHENAEYQRTHTGDDAVERGDVVFEVTDAHGGISTATLTVANITVEQYRGADVTTNRGAQNTYSVEGGEAVVLTEENFDAAHEAVVQPAVVVGEMEALGEDMGIGAGTAGTEMNLDDEPVVQPQPAVAAVDDTPADLMVAGEGVDIELTFERMPDYDTFQAKYAEKHLDAYAVEPDNDELEKAYTDFVVQCDLLTVGEDDAVSYKAGIGGAGEYNYTHVTSGEKHCRLDLKNDDACRVKTPDVSYELRGDDKYTLGADGTFTEKVDEMTVSFSDRRALTERELFNDDASSIGSSASRGVRAEDLGVGGVAQAQEGVDLSALTTGTTGELTPGTDDDRSTVSRASTRSTFSTPPAPASVISSVSAASTDTVLTLADLEVQLKEMAEKKKTDKDLKKDQRAVRQDERAEGRDERRKKRDLKRKEKEAKRDLHEEYAEDRDEIEEKAGSALKYGGGTAGVLLVIGIAFPPVAVAGFIVAGVTAAYELNQGNNWMQSRWEEFQAKKDLSADFADDRADLKDASKERREQLAERRQSIESTQSAAIAAEGFRAQVEEAVNNLKAQGHDSGTFVATFDKDGRLVVASDAAELASLREPAATGDARTMARKTTAQGVDDVADTALTMAVTAELVDLVR